MIAMPFKSEDDANDFIKQITEAALRWCQSIWWYNWQQPFEKLKITGASCFVLKFKTRYIGVTAAHVVKELLEARRYTASLDCRLQLIPFNLLYAVIDMNDDLDIATFSISEQKVQDAGIQAFDVSVEWPPPDRLIIRQMPIQLIGFPECLRIIDYASSSVICQAYQALTLVEDCNDRDIIAIYDPMQSRGTPTLLPLGFNMSGCSGGPAVIHETRNRIHRWHPVGLIVGGPRGQGEGGSAQSDIIRIRRIDCIDQEGHIRAASTGWLPP
jgi:hypothetical protein